MSKVRHYKLYESTISQFRAKRDRAIATLDIYFNHSVGVGEHPTHTEDICALTKELAEAEECMEALTKHFGRCEARDGRD